MTGRDGGAEGREGRPGLRGSCVPVRLSVWAGEMLGRERGCLCDTHDMVQLAKSVLRRVLERAETPVAAEE